MKTRVKTANLKYSGFLYHAQLFTVQNTMPKCRWYSKSLYFRLTVFPLHLEQQLYICKKCSGITVNLCTLFSVWPIFAVYCCNLWKQVHSIIPKTVIILHILEFATNYENLNLALVITEDSVHNTTDPGYMQFNAYFGGNNLLGAVVGLRLIIISADIGIYYFGRKLLKKLNRSPHLIFWYFLPVFSPDLPFSPYSS